jgi:hypothetical protein
MSAQTADHNTLEVRQAFKVGFSRTLELSQSQLPARVYNCCEVGLGGECQSFTNNLRNCTNLGDWYEDSWKAFEWMLMLGFVRGNQISPFGPDAGAACVILLMMGA